MSAPAASTANHDAWLTLRLVPDVGRVRFHRLVEAFGSPDAVLGQGVEALRRVPGVDHTAENIVRHRELVDLEREKDLIEARGARIVTLHDPDYPANLRGSLLPPPFLYVLGTLEEADRFAIAIVGSRVSTLQGRTAAAQIAAQLVAAGIVIISGMATGIDSAAHRAALENGGRTIAVVANGLSRCYPAENRPLAEAVAAHGAVVSEYPMDEPPAKMNFPERNRVLASLALGTIVAEAPRRSGALITADAAIEENRALYAIPADITRRTAEGSNALIRQGAARLITSGNDVLEDLQGQLRGLLREQGVDGNGAEAPKPQLSEEEGKLLAAIAPEPVSMDDLLARFGAEGMTVGRLSTLLLGLEMKKLVRQMPGKIFRAEG